MSRFVIARPVKQPAYKRNLNVYEVTLHAASVRFTDIKVHYSSPVGDSVIICSLCDEPTCQLCSCKISI